MRHARVERSRTEVRACRRHNPGIEESAIGHAVLHQLFAIEIELVGVVVRIRREHGGNGAGRLDAPHQVVVDQRAMGDLGTRVGSREQLLRALDRGQHHIDRDIPIGVAVDLDARAMHPLDPGVEIVLRLRDVALVRRSDAGIGRAERHRALGERPVDRVLRGGSEPDPLVAEAGLQCRRRSSPPAPCRWPHSSPGAAVLRAPAPAAGRTDRRPRDARWSRHSGQTVWRCRPARRDRAAASVPR